MSECALDRDPGTYFQTRELIVPTYLLIHTSPDTPTCALEPSWGSGRRAVTRGNVRMHPAIIIQSSNGDIRVYSSYK